MIIFDSYIFTVFIGGYQAVSGFMGPSQGSPVRHVQYPTPGANYNPMSPTNQGVYIYGQSPINQYPMQGYNMPPMNTLPVHMMPPLPNPEQLPDPAMQGQENINRVSISGPGVVGSHIYERNCFHWDLILLLFLMLFQTIFSRFNHQTIIK